SGNKVVHDFVHEHLAGLAFELGGTQHHGAEAPLHLFQYAFRDQDLIGLGDPANAGGDAHGVPDGGVFHAGTGADAAYHGLAAIDADADLEIGNPLPPPFREHFAQALPHLQRGLHRREFVIGHGHRGVEKHHHAVADELVQGSAVGEHDFAHFGEITVQQ